MADLKMHTPNLTDVNIAKLAELFPHCITESHDSKGNLIRAVDFDLLRQELSGIVVEGDQERYRLDWVGKKQAMLTANAPIAKTLRPQREQSVDFDTTQNLFIEGDNLDALKLLQESYLDKVKMIYIDPPYNTGNDFIYKDNFAESTQAFLERSEQIDEEGNRLVANTESNGRYHSDWLSMMYSRLKLARNLLTDDGVIFISIDDNEQANLKRLCDEIFGAGNFVAQIMPVVNPGGRDYNQVAITHEYILCYAKTTLLELNEVSKDTEFRFFDSLGGYEYRELRNRNPKFHSGNRPNLFYPFYVNPNSMDENGYCCVSLCKNEKFNIEVFPYNSQGKESVWRWGKVKSEANIQVDHDASQILARQTREGKWNIYEKNRRSTTKVKSIWDDTAIRTEDGTRLLRMLFNETYFNHPKSLDLVKKLVEIGANPEDIILDFFAGSATTAHAVMQLNAEDGGNRRFIMVQLPEETDTKSEAYKAGYPTIAEISKERIRRAGAKIKSELVDQAAIEQLDTGFRVLKVDDSNMQDVYYRPQELTLDLVEQMADHIKADRGDEDLLFQVMLDLGIELSLPIECRQIDGRDVYFVAGNSLVACFNHLSMAIIDEVATMQPLYFVSCERAIQQDHDKANFKERFRQLSHKTDVRFI